MGDGKRRRKKRKRSTPVAELCSIHVLTPPEAILTGLKGASLEKN